MTQNLNNFSKVLILGAGYAGLQAALDLGSSGIQCTLVDKNDYHDLLPELPHRLSDPNLETKIAIKDLIKNKAIKFIQAKAKQINYQNKHVVLENGDSLSFEYLVLAVGTNSNFFNIPGLEANSLTFHNSNDVDAFSKHLKSKFLKAKEFAKGSEDYKNHLSLVIGGGGLTGVEIAGELIHQIPKIARELGIPNQDINIYLVEAQAKLLMVLDKEVSETVTNFFEKQKDKIHLLTNSAIKEAKPGQIELTDGRIIKAETILWTGGIRANKFLETPYINSNGQEAKFTLNRGFRIEVEEFYKVANVEKTYAVGDNAYIIDPATKQPFPQNGQAAYKQGRAVAKYIYADMQSVRPRQKKITLDGLLVSLGPKLGSGMIINPLTCYLPISLWARKIKKAIELRYRLFDIRR